MKRATSRLALVFAAVVFAGTASAQEQKIRREDLPPAVRQAVDAETKGAVVKGFARETEDGRTFYEAETLVAGHTRDLLFDASGTLVEIEEATTLQQLPAPVRDAFERAGNVTRVETVTRKSVVTYEAVVQKNGRKTEMTLDADGKPVK